MRRNKHIYHRKVWEQHYGAIPKDSDGRSYEIHHIDGNHKNNDISNLACVTIQEHYAIHYAQGDYAACMIMFDRMQVSPEEKSRIAKLANTGENNPMYGTRWINNGVVNKKIDGKDALPEGWQYGRLISDEYASKFTKRSKSGKNNTNYDPTPYRFTNDNLGITVEMPRYDFAVEYNICSRKIRELAKGRLVSYRGWTATVC